MVWFFFLGLTKISQFLFIFWIWKIFLDVLFLCWFKRDFSIWNVFRFEKKLLIQKIVVDIENITRPEKELSILKNICWFVKCILWTNILVHFRMEFSESNVHCFTTSLFHVTDLNHTRFYILMCKLIIYFRK